MHTNRRRRNQLAIPDSTDYFENASVSGVDEPVHCLGTRKHVWLLPAAGWRRCRRNWEASVEMDIPRQQVVDSPNIRGEDSRMGVIDVTEGSGGPTHFDTACDALTAGTVPGGGGSKV